MGSTELTAESLIGPGGLLSRLLAPGEWSGWERALGLAKPRYRNEPDLPPYRGREPWLAPQPIGALSHFLTARDVAEVLDVSPETVLRWTRRGALDGVAFQLPGGGLRYREGAFEDWLAKRATTERGVVSHPQYDVED